MRIGFVCVNLYNVWIILKNLYVVDGDCCFCIELMFESNIIVDGFDEVV